MADNKALDTDRGSGGFEWKLYLPRPVNAVVRPSSIMSHILKWPEEFAAPTPVTDFDAALFDLFNELVTMGVGRSRGCTLVVVRL